MEFSTPRVALDVVRILVGDFVGEEIGRGVGLLFQRIEIALQFLIHGVEDHVILSPESDRGDGQQRGDIENSHNV